MEDSKRAVCDLERNGKPCDYVGPNCTDIQQAEADLRQHIKVVHGITVIVGQTDAPAKRT